MFAKYLTEFIGTFFLVLTIGLTVTQDWAGTPMAPLAIGCALMIMVYMGGHVSGAHYNPAVSLAAALRGAMSMVDLIPYWIFQIAGALAASFVVSVIIPVGENPADLANFFGPAPGDGYDLSSPGPWIVEILFTFALALVVLNTATSAGTKNNSFYGLAIGFTVVVAAFAGGGISGGAFNPAVGIGPNVIKQFVGGADGVISNLGLHVVGPLIGGALAAFVFQIQEMFVVKQENA